MLKRASILLGLFALSMGQPAIAAVSCWNQAVTEAAQVKQFDIMMMVSTIRCHRKGVDLSSDYNKFVVSRRTVLQGVGKELVKQFGLNLRGNAAVMAYDHLGVVMANSFGNDGRGTRNCEDIRAIIKDALIAEPDRVNLVYLAQRNGINPLLPVASCAPALYATPALTAEGMWAPVGRYWEVSLPPVPDIDFKGKKRRR